VSEQYRYFVGIDWATECHEVCILDADGRAIDRRTVEHTGSGIAQLLGYLKELTDGRLWELAAGVETPRGAIVESLMEQQVHVYSLNPKQMDRFRDRHTVAGAKDDRRDALVIADSLRTDRHLFRRARVDDPLIIRIRELSHSEQDMQQQQIRVTNQLRDLLWRYFPEVVRLSPALDEPWVWDLLALAPLPEQACKLRRSCMEKILRSHRIRRLTAQEVCAQLKTQALQLAPGAAAATAEHVLLLLPLLHTLHTQRKQILSRMEAVLGQMQEEEQAREHRDVRVLLSMPGAGRIVAATMLAEASQALAERDYHALRSYAGVAPITRQSGHHRVTGMRRSCNQRLRNAVYHWSLGSIQYDPRSHEHYAALRKKGHSHARALRGVADRLLAVLTAMLKAGTSYDPTLRSAVTSS
jgi:transposase